MEPVCFVGDPALFSVLHNATTATYKNILKNFAGDSAKFRLPAFKKSSLLPRIAATTCRLVKNAITFS
jgi:hypothetical protein